MCCEAYVNLIEYQQVIHRVMHILWIKAQKRRILSGGSCHSMPMIPESTAVRQSPFGETYADFKQAVNLDTGQEAKL